MTALSTSSLKDAAPDEQRAFVRARLLAAIAALTVLVVSYVYAPYASDGPVVCPVRGILGIPCPSCGLTRAFCALAHLELSEALRYHALSPLLFAAVAATPFVAGYEIATRRAVANRWLSSSRLAWALAGLFLAHHVIRSAAWLTDPATLDSHLRGSWTYAVLETLGFLRS